MKNNKRFRKIFRKNMILISAMFLAFAFIVMSCLVAFNISVRKEKMNILETDEAEKTGAVASNTLYHIAASAVYFSTRNFSISTDTLSDDTTQIYSIKKEMQTVCATFNAVESIKVINSQNGYSISTGTVNAKGYKKGKSYGKFGDITLYENLNEDGSKLFMVTETQSGGYVGNKVYIGINTEYLAETVLLSVNDLRNEYVVDSKGNIVIANSRFQINNKISKVLGTKINLTDGKSSIIRIDGIKTIATCKKFENLDFYVVGLADASIYKNLDSINNILIGLMVLACISVGFVITYMILKFTYKPVENILSQVGDMALMDQKSLDEVDYINAKIKKLTSSNNELSELVDEKMQELTNQHIAALQAQICPHFIYNTLEAINWIAYRTLNERKNDISKAILNMSELYRSTININEIFRTVEDECKFTESYIEILHIRCPNTYTVLWDVDESVKKYNILKLSIQPLIENIANHALGDGVEKITIKISIHDAGSTIHVSVSDDGIGMSPEKLREINTLITDFDSGEKHLGMRNINERLQLLYGEEYGITVNSTLGKGTTIKFLYPKGGLEEDF